MSYDEQKNLNNERSVENALAILEEGQLLALPQDKVSKQTAMKDIHHTEASNVISSVVK